ncbi:site-2 protease family protein [soil metagenome]
MLGNSIRLFSVRGIDVGIHFSWFIIFGLVTYSLGTAYFPDRIPGISGPEALLLGAVASVLLFVSVLVHELAHSFMARARGLDAKSITLFLFGGVSNLGGEAKRPSTEFLVAIVGPLTSFVIAGLSFGAALVLTEPRAREIAAYLTFINVALGLFNLLPGFPLDGGRVFRAIVWNATGSVRRATEVAAFAGKLIAYAFFAWGFVQVLGGNLLGGIWIAAIGWFLQNAASSSLQQVILDQRLKDVLVGHVMRRDPTAVAPGISVAELIEDHLLPGNRRAMPVVDNTRLVGVVTLGDVTSVPAAERAATPVGQVMGGRDGMVTVVPSDTLRKAVDGLGSGDYEQLPVVEDGQLVGMLTRADVMRQIQLREALNLEGRAVAD